MKYYANPEKVSEAIAGPQKRMLGVISSSLLAGVLISYVIIPPIPNKVYILVASSILGILLMWLGLTTTRRKNTLKLQSIEIEIQEDSIIRRLSGWKDIHLKKKAITRIDRTTSGGFAIYADSAKAEMFIPAFIDGLEHLEIALNEIVEVSAAPVRNRTKFLWLLVYLESILSVLFFVLKDSLYVSIIGVLLIAILIFSAYSIIFSRTINRRAKLITFTLVTFVLFIAWRTILAIGVFLAR